jgi:very-short-patch-repair endonuclease
MKGLPLLAQIAALKLPTPETEVRVIPSRRFRFDYCWPDRKIALEVDGATWTGGRHTRGAGVAKDCEKVCEAAIAGWKVLRVTTQQVENGQAIGWLERLLKP